MFNVFLFKLFSENVCTVGHEAPALGGQGGRVPTLEIICVGIANPEFPSLKIV